MHTKMKKTPTEVSGKRHEKLQNLAQHLFHFARIWLASDLFFGIDQGRFRFGMAAAATLLFFQVDIEHAAARRHQSDLADLVLMLFQQVFGEAHGPFEHRSGCAVNDGNLFHNTLL